MSRQYAVSERAHFMCPNMHFGIKMDIPKPFIQSDVQETLQRLAQAHPFLRCVMAIEEETGRLYYKETAHAQIILRVNNTPASLWDDYRGISSRGWDVFSSGLLEVSIYPRKQGMTVLFAAHHLLSDGRGLLGLVKEFADDYVRGIHPSYAKEQLIKDVCDLPPGSSLSGISRLIVHLANRQWKKEGRTVPYAQYLEFAKAYGQSHPVEYAAYEMPSNELAEIQRICRNNGFTVNDWLMASMFMKTGAKEIILAADIRRHLGDHPMGALGNYATATGICLKARTQNIINLSRRVHRLVQKRLQNPRRLMLILSCYFDMEPGLLDAAAISALGGFRSTAGLFAGGWMLGYRQPSAYSITNLGSIESSCIESLTFIPPASPAVRLSLGVITLNGKLMACSARNV